jgi:hypothetical protein
VDSSRTYTKIVEGFAHFFERPEARLRFLNHTLARQTASRERADQALSRLKFFRRSRIYDYLLRAWLYHLIFQELDGYRSQTESSRRGFAGLTRTAPLAARLSFRCYQLRHALGAVAMVLLCVSLYGAYLGLAWTAGQANNYLTARYRKVVGVAQGGGPGTAYGQTALLPDYKPEKVWLVEEGTGFERYSNGARILLDLATENRPRGYYLFRDGVPQSSEGLKREPIGIVYHTSENDMLPFTPDNSDSIEVRSRGLLEYVRRNKSYNYVIDRFGQIHRIVRDEDAANHAGNSVWAGAGGTYVGLNDSFIGVCFETSMEADGEERLTEAQLVSGRLLTQVIRSRYQIDDANCVTHGLVSINPTTMGIAFHHDWARGFPFAAMGLSDKYRIAPASVAEFGFTYDEGTVEKLGGVIWQGVAVAEEEFGRRAAAAQTEPDTLRRRMRDAYRERMEIQRRARATAGGGEAPGRTEQEEAGR